MFFNPFSFFSLQNVKIRLLTPFLILVLLAILTGFSGGSHHAGKKQRYKEGELLVKFKKGIGGSKASTQHKVLGARVMKRFEGLNIEHIRLPEGMTVDEALALYKNNPDVEYAEPNYRFKKAALPNDPKYSQQWHHVKIDLVSGWDITTGDGNIIVAVVDTGIDYNHPDLKDNMWKDSQGFYGKDFVNGDNDPMDDDVDGSGSHGTHVAGIIGAVGDNGVGVTGINWKIKLMALKVLDRNGDGYMSDIVSAIRYAVDEGGKIINLSLEAGENVAGINSLKDAVEYAKNNGVLVISAAGNSGYNLNYVNVYPASLRMENLISVAATGSSDERDYHSNYGTNVVHIAAPGTNIYSTQSALAPGFKNYSTGYFSETGTSMAAPMVSGVAALIWSKYPDLSYKEVKERILASVDKVNGLNVITGGRLNAHLALTIDLDNMPPLKPENFSLDGELKAGGPIKLKWTDLSSLETCYKIERSLRSESVFSLLTTLPENSSDYTDSSAILQEGDRVGYRLFACNDNGDSEAVLLDLQIPLNKPTNLSVTRMAEGIKLTWQDNTTNEDGYEIRRQSGEES